MRKLRNFWIYLSLVIPSFVGLGIHSYLGSFNRFISDDFCSALFAERLGVFRSVWFWYLNWFGTYSASFMDTLLPLMGTRGITYSVFTVLMIWLVIIVVAIFSLLPREIAISDRVFTAIALGSTLIFVTLLISPNVPQSLYWWGGMRAYIPPLIFAALFVTLYKQLTANDYPDNYVYWMFGLSLLVSLVGGGFSEIFIPVQLVFFVFIILLGLVTGKLSIKSREFIFLAIGLFGSILALMLVIMAPGNAKRQAFFPASPDVILILGIALNGFLSFLKDIVGTPDKAAGLSALAIAATWLGMQCPPSRVPKGWIAPFILFTGFIVAFGCFPSAAYGMSDVPPTRTLIIPAYFLVISLTLAGYCFGRWLAHALKYETSSVIKIGFSVSVTAMMLFSAWVNGQVLLSGRPKYSDYAVQWDQMNAQILNAKTAGEALVIIPEMVNWAGLDNPNDNPKFWVNYCMSEFYGINVLAGSTAQ